MLKIYDCECQGCGNIEERISEDGVNFDPCSNCGEEMKRIFTSFNFRLKYNNKTDVCSWGNHGYETSQYWKDVKEARARGENVKSASCKY